MLGTRFRRTLASRVVLALLAWWVLGIGSASAHKENVAFVQVELGCGEAYISVEISVIDLAILVGEPDAKPGDPALQAAANAVVQRAVFLRVDGAPEPLPQPLGAEVVARAGGAFVRLDYRPTAGNVQGMALDIRIHEILGPRHKTLAKVSIDHHTQYAVFDAGQTRFRFGDAPRPMHTFGRFLRVGTEHVLGGLDHLLFLLALLLGTSGRGQLLRNVSAFTVGHSLTLALAVLGVVAPPVVVVEAMIALSIVFVASENLLRAEITRRWPVAVAFGLIHGFGFAGVLSDLGLEWAALATALPGFNIGVELGQLLAVAPAVAVALWIGPRVSEAARDRSAFLLSSAVLAAGWFWFCQRVGEL